MTPAAAWHPVACRFCRTAFAFKARSEDTPCAACPGCGRYQPDMLDAARQQRFGGYTLIAGLLALVGILVAAVTPGVWLVNVVSSPAVLFQVVALGLFVRGRLLAERCDPNADAHLRMGERPSHVILREEFEAVRELASLQGVDFPALTWAEAPSLGTQRAAAA